MSLRVQASLFVAPDAGAEIEAVRRRVDPVQHRLIPAHVTLCREDELGEVSLDDVHARLRHPPGPIALRFGAPVVFGEHGILLPCVDGLDAFQSLRRRVLADPHVRPHVPHLTLAHPRNPKAPGNALEAAASLGAGRCLVFDAIHLIAQVDDEPWVVRGVVPLVDRPRGLA